MTFPDIPGADRGMNVPGQIGRSREYDREIERRSGLMTFPDIPGADRGVMSFDRFLCTKERIDILYE